MSLLYPDPYLEAAQCQYSRERHGGEVMIGRYGYTGIRPYEETCDQYTWYGTRVRCSFKTLFQQKLLKLYNKLSRLLLLYVLFCCKWVHSSVMTGECMFQHCWFGCIFVFTGIHQAQSPKTPPDAPPHPQASVAETFLSAGLHSNMGSQEATWDQLIRDDWTPPSFC